MTTLAVLGGPPAFPGGLPFARPYLPELARVAERLAPSYERGVLTNGPLVRELEDRAAERLGADHVVAVSSCTAGLMLVLRVLEPGGPVVVPSFTFSATAHAIAWNGLAPRFAECDPDTFQVDPVDAGRRLEGAGAVMGTHVFGAPCPVEDLAALATGHGLPLVFDAAHAFGATRAGTPVGGFGDAEVFSMSPTKLVVAGEGGLVATRNAELAAAIRIGRDYANPGDYDTRFVGLNARLSELHAAVALESIDLLDDHLARRAALARRYREGLAAVPGITPQVVGPADRSTWKDLTVQVDADDFGLDRDGLVTALAAEGIDTRRYFDPPVHRQTAHVAAGDPLPVTDRVASRVVSLPMFAELPAADVDRVVAVLADLHRHAARVRRAATG